MNISWKLLPSNWAQRWHDLPSIQDGLCFGLVREWDQYYGDSCGSATLIDIIMVSLRLNQNQSGWFPHPRPAASLLLHSILISDIIDWPQPEKWSNYYTLRSWTQSQPQATLRGEVKSSSPGPIISVIHISLCNNPRAFISDRKYLSCEDFTTSSDDISWLLMVFRGCC